MVMAGHYSIVIDNRRQDLILTAIRRTMSRTADCDRIAIREAFCHIKEVNGVLHKNATRYASIPKPMLG